MVSETDDEPLTPAGRLFVQPLMDQIIHGVFMLENPIDVDAIKRAIEESVMLKHPRFSSLMVADASSGREHWRRTQVDLDRHVIVRGEPVDAEGKSDADSVNDYVADLTVSSPLARDKPLWEVHILTAHNALLFRVHHALGDGISLMSMLLSSCRLRDDTTRTPSLGGGASSSSSSSNAAKDWKSSLWRWIKVVWYTLIYVMDFATRAIWVSDRSTVVSGGEGVELWPRKLATARFRLEDMKAVKRAVPGATINDVLFGIISCGLSRYLDIRSSDALQDGLRITGLSMVNLRPQGGLKDMYKLMKSGNKFGMILLPVYYRRGESNPLHFVSRAKKMIDKKKLSLEAFFSYKIGYIIMSLFGAKAASILNYRIVCNTTFTISNVVGPQEEITIGDNPVKSIIATVTSLPHGITMHMMSYAGFADMQILVAKEIIPEPKVLARCFEGALLEMKDQLNREK